MLSTLQPLELHNGDRMSRDEFLRRWEQVSIAQGFIKLFLVVCCVTMRASASRICSLRKTRLFPPPMDLRCNLMSHG